MAKNNLALIALLSISVTAYAQHETLPPAKGEKPLLKIDLRFLSPAQVPEYLQQYEALQNQVDSQPRLLFRNYIPQGSPGFVVNSKATVYTLPPDNMPCLVPDMEQVERMPVARPRTESRMPNAIPVKPLIPQEREKRK